MRVVRLDRLQEYPSATLAEVCKSIGLAPVTREQVTSAVSSDPRDGHNDKNQNHLGRIKFLFENPSDDDIDAIMLCNGLPYRQPDLDEPHFYDGRHRFIAAVVRGDATIKAEFRWYSGKLEEFLSRPVIAYLAGDSDVKPRGTWREWQESPDYMDYY